MIERPTKREVSKSRREMIHEVIECITKNKRRERNRKNFVYLLVEIASKLDVFERGREVRDILIERTSKSEVGERGREVGGFLVEFIAKREVGEGRSEVEERLIERIAKNDTSGIKWERFCGADNHVFWRENYTLPPIWYSAIKIQYIYKLFK